MKRVIGLVIALFCLMQINAQDIIIMKSGERIDAKVLEVSENSVVYKLASNPDGPSYSRKTANIVSIIYENGSVDMLDKISANEEAAIPPIREGMKYKELKEFYDPYYYTKDRKDPYKPWLMGISSFIVPGLGQIFEGETTTGLIMLGADLGLTWVLNSIGTEVYNNDTHLTERQLSSSEESIYTIVYIGRLAMEIFAIVDAVKCAKVKNLYKRDLLNMKNSTSFSLSPSFDLTPSTIGYVPSAGLTASIRF
ncbi:MAG: hypothetical protein MJY79_02470 [Bacteroidaceae bacterium]|nr:hypothetical protein [Bacteroidaceae bacterium]